MSSQQTALKPELFKNSFRVHYERKRFQQGTPLYVANTAYAGISRPYTVEVTIDDDDDDVDDVRPCRSSSI